MFAGDVDPGNIVIVREIIDGARDSDVDSAVFSDFEINYTVTTVPQGAEVGSPGSVTTVTHLDTVDPEDDTPGVEGEDDALSTDGVDTLRNVEQLLFADSQPPARATILSASASNGTATVNWDGPAGSAVSGYRVKVLNTKDQQMGALRVTNGDATSLTVTGLTNGVGYRFQVQAFNGAGGGPYSAVSNTVTPGPVLPGAPTVGSPTGGRGSGTITWVPGADGGSPVTGFTVRVVDATGSQVGALRTAPGTATSLDMTGLPAGIQLRFQVAAENAVGTGAYSTVSIPLAATPSPFPDVRQDGAFFTEIVWLLDQKITTGYLEDGTFRPFHPVNRDMMAAFMYRFVGEPDFVPPKVSPFKDLPVGGRFYKEITWLAAQGITTGYPDRTFRPHLAVNRDMMAAFMYRFADEPDFVPPGSSPFSDVRKSGDFYQEIMWLASTEITTGYPDKTFKPFTAVNRDMMAAFMYRFHNLIAP